MQYGTEWKIGEIKDFKGLVRYLRDDLDWPLDLDEIEDLTFEYEAEELGLKSELAVKVKEIKQLRPVVDRQPWGIFWVEFENRALPVTVMRQILRALVHKKRATAKAADRKAWHLKDLIFMSSLGEKGNRRINFSYFRETGEGEPTLQTFFWDEQETQFYWLDRNHLERLRWPADTTDIESWRQQWASAFTAGYREPVRTAKDLSERLAALAANTRDAVLDVLRYESSEGPLHCLLESFQTVLLHDLDEGGFADMIAQTIAYGLFSARCTGQEVLGLAHLEAMVPNTNRFLKELFAELAKISGHKKGQINFDDLGLSEMVALLRDKNIEAVLEEFGRQAGGGKEDPVIHFYETFLNVYDKQQKVQRGVFYTPKPVVSFIVRSVHEVLQKEFGLVDGLADVTTWGEMAQRVPGLTVPKEAKASDPFVQILDPATGTGTFLEEVIELVHSTMLAKWRKEGRSLSAVRAAWNDYVPKNLLPRLRGFELMMAPYAVAHMKIGLKLSQTGYDFKSSERLRVFLTNTLEPAEKGNRKLGFLPDFLSHESLQADQVKEKKAITVVLGNPPYSGHSVNNQIPWAVEKVYDYKRGIPDLHKPAQAKWLQDDYVKFLRYAQFRIDCAGAGIVGFITNHSYLDNPTFLGMRRAFVSSFTTIRLLDLHGNSKKKEVAQDGTKDENVFDIQQGVAISILANVPRRHPECWHGDLYGLREKKYENLLRLTLSDKTWQTFSPEPPRYLFVPRVDDLDAEYSQAYSLPDIFNQNGDPAPGIVTTHDEFAISWTKEEACRKVQELLETRSEREARELFQLCTQAQWNYTRAKAELRRIDWAEQATTILYRPFDVRWTIYNSNVAVHRRDRVMRHMLSGKNIGMITSRQTKDSWAALATDCICGHKACAGYDINYLFPLFLYHADLDGSIRTVPNLNPIFTTEIEKRLAIAFQESGGGQSRTTFDPYDVFHYIYAITFSPLYRERYDEYLKRDFARIPITSDVRLFWRLVSHGERLTALHVFRTCPQTTASFEGHGSPIIEEVSYDEERRSVTIGPAGAFDGIRPEVWSFRLGGYQVCQKWLKDRKGRRLGKRERQHYERIVGIIEETLNAMRRIDTDIESCSGGTGSFGTSAVS